MKLNTIKSRPGISMKTPILLLTGYTATLISSKSTFLWIYSTAMTFSSNSSGSSKVVAIYIGFYGAYWRPS
jgi:hypothetical protein